MGADSQPSGSRFDRSFIALGAAADGLGVALESTLLAERELHTGRLLSPVRGQWEDVTYVGQFLAFPRSQFRQRPFRLSHDWIRQELNLGTPQGPDSTASRPDQAGSGSG